MFCILFLRRKRNNTYDNGQPSGVLKQFFSARFYIFFTYRKNDMIYCHDRTQLK